MQEGIYHVVVKAIVFKDRQVLLMKRSDYLKSNTFEWDVPGGRLRPGEDPFVGIHRETLEETGIKIRVGSAFDLYCFPDKEARARRLVVNFLSTYISGDLQASYEHTYLGWYDMDRIPTEVTPWVRETVKKAYEFYRCVGDRFGLRPAG